MSDPNKWSLLSKSGWESPSNNEMKRWTDTGHWLFEKVDDLIDPPSLLLLLAPHFVLWSRDTQNERLDSILSLRTFTAWKSKSHDFYEVKLWDMGKIDSKSDIYYQHLQIYLLF